jgi:hypothetical protein
MGTTLATIAKNAITVIHFALAAFKQAAQKVGAFQASSPIKLL